MQPVDYPDLLHPHHVNVSQAVLRFYTEDIVPRIAARKDGVRRALTQLEDDRQYGSSAICDVEALSAINRRVHFGGLRD